MLRSAPFLLVALTLTSCQETSFVVKGDPENALSDGSIEGRVCDPSGRTWLADAMIYTHLRTDEGQIYHTEVAYSDRDGRFLLDNLPPGHSYDVYVQVDGDILETHDEVTVADGQAVVLKEPSCFDPLRVNVAVITGDYDDFELVLNNMGFANYDPIDGLSQYHITDFLLDYDSMERYDIIFFNGGHVEEGVIYESDNPDEDEEGVPATIRRNIKAYVEAGGSIYASDWAYDVVEQIWPTRVNWVGDDSVPDAAQVGEYGLINAAISDAALASFLDTDRMEIEFDLPVWPVIENVDASVSVHLTGQVSYREGTYSFTLPSAPILISFTAGEGKVAFASFRVAKNSTSDMVMTLQYMMYNL